jgi:transposase InsO family protein
VYLVLVLDWYTKKIVGHYAGLRAKTTHWLTALHLAVQRQFPHGSREHGLHLMSDNGRQPSSVTFMKAAATLGITQAFTSYNNPKGNADTERAHADPQGRAALAPRVDQSAGVGTIAHRMG